MKALEHKEFSGGLGGGHLRRRVVECEALEPGAVRVSDDAPLCDWTAEAVDARPWVDGETAEPPAG